MLPALKVSEDRLIHDFKDGRGTILPPIIWSEQILNRGTEKYLNLLFYATQLSNLEDALLGWLAPGTYKLTLALRKRKLWAKTEYINMEVDFTQEMYQAFWYAQVTVTAVREEGKSLFRLLPARKRRDQFWKNG
ncbi:MAG: hypothetical protein ACXV39_12215 [Halobacteriota archaeon]